MIVPHSFKPSSVTGWFRDCVRVSLLLPVLLPLSASCSAESRELVAKVIWLREDRVYLASRDSIALAAGTLVTFMDRDRPIAAGVIESVYERTLAVAKLSSGTLGRVKKLDRLRIRAEPPRPLVPTLLRVGFPAAHRTSLLFTCSPMSAASPLVPHVYRLDGSTEGSWRLVRNPVVQSRAPWPDTVMVQRFESAADEEIALERGELDVAVFWPGELSTHMREDPRWKGAAYGYRARGVVAAFRQGAEPLGAGGGAVPESLVASLNQQLFRGDLAPWPAAAAVSPDSSSVFRRRQPATPRFTVDSSLPGGRVIERFLNRAERRPGPGDDPAVIRVFYLDAPAAASDSVALVTAEYVRSGADSRSLRARADSLAMRARGWAAAGESPPPERLREVLREVGVTPWFVVRCPVLCGPEIRPLVDALGPDTFANIVGCGRAGHRP